MKRIMGSIRKRLDGNERREKVIDSLMALYAQSVQSLQSRWERIRQLQDEESRINSTLSQVKVNYENSNRAADQKLKAREEILRGYMSIALNCTKDTSASEMTSISEYDESALRRLAVLIDRGSTNDPNAQLLYALCWDQLRFLLAESIHEAEVRKNDFQKLMIIPIHIRG